ncbi:MAG: hypothetical protein HGA61_03635, partial [Candidatus Moranbacteria bacterium]|nr:hypothetical protein [Candidatus Moranbacteria bacterium]
HCSYAAIFDAQAVVDLVNKDRFEKNIEPLKVSKELTAAAKEKAGDMVLHNYFAHISPSGSTPWQWIGQSGYDYSFAGENLAINFNDPELQHLAFMKSESHRKNILNPNYKEIGVAVIYGKINGKQTIITVQEFGARASAPLNEKKISGISTDKKSLTSNAIFSIEKIGQNIHTGVFSIENSFSYVSEKISSIPLIGFLHMSILLIATAFFLYEMFAAHFHFAVHHFFLHKKRKIFAIESAGPAPRNLPERFIDTIRFGKIYLTHMKLKK